MLNAPFNAKILLPQFMPFSRPSQAGAARCSSSRSTIQGAMVRFTRPL
jgi:hypothetical protein